MAKQEDNTTRVPHPTNEGEHVDFYGFGIRQLEVLTAYEELLAAEKEATSKHLTHGRSNKR
jgi:hypothetical protein